MIETTDEGTLPFQHWFVRRRAEPAVRRVFFDGNPLPAPDVLPAIERADAILIGPSNPYVSIDPILSLDGVRDALARKPVIAVSPIVRGAAVKGPLASMIPALAHRAPTAHAIAAHYGSLITAIVVESGDEQGLAIPALATSTIMRTRDDRLRLAQETIDFAARVSAGGRA
jgi:LPPG:FO 2-phospho-L-lactate transferase